MRKTGTRLLAVLLAVVMVLPSVLIPGMAAEATGFTDVPEGSWYEDAVNYVSEKGYMAGVGDNKFAPNDEVTRAMFVTILARITMAETDGTVSAFTDVPENKWYTGAVSWAAENGIVNGVGDRMFAPGKSITRQDLCTILYRFVNAMDYELTVGEEKTFTDGASVSSYAAEAVRYASSVGLIAGYDDGTFRPKATATRAQMAVIIMRLARLLDGQIVKPEPMPAQSFDQTSEQMQVSVNAPEGALPENTKMTVSRVTDEAALAAIEAKAGTKVYAAADISFSKDETEIEPSAEVEVQIVMDGLESIKNPTVVHVKDDGSLEYVAAEVVSATRGSEKALRFYAKDFSVYAVTDNQTNATLTISFYAQTRGTSGGWEIVNKQIIRNDQLGAGKYPIADPGVPNITTSQAFEGWIQGTSSFNSGFTYGTDATTKTVKQINEDYQGGLAGNTEIVYYAAVYDVVYVTYHDQAGAVTFAEYHKIPAGSNSVSVTITEDYPPMKSNQNFSGWVKEDDVAVPGGVDGTLPTYQGGAGARKWPLDSIQNISENVDLYPYVEEGYWLSFNNNIAKNSQKLGFEDDTSAEYISPIFIPKGTTPTQPAFPSNDPRHGYTFAGWYKDADMTTAFNFNQQLTEDTTVYAKWAFATTSYRVIYWKQRATDEYTYTDEQKNYDYFDSRTVPGAATGSVVGISNSGTNNDTTKNVAQNNENNFYFRFNSSKSDKTVADGSTVRVKGDGTTVLNVYYDRKTITYNFGQLNYYQTYQMTYTHSNLYGHQYKESDWHSAGSGNTWSCKDISTGEVYQFPMALMEYVPTWHNLSNPNDSYLTMNFYVSQYNTNTIPVKYVGASLTNSSLYNVALTSGTGSKGGYWYPDETVEGFTVTGYAFLSSAPTSSTTWKPCTQASVIPLDASETGTLYVAFSRNNYTLTYSSTNNVGTQTEDETIPYEKSLTSYKSHTPANSYPGYYFAGWYLDKEGTQSFDLENMPARNIIVYAKWNPKWYRIVVDYKRGNSSSVITVPGSTQKASFTVQYGSTIQTSSLMQAQRLDLDDGNDNWMLVGLYLDEACTKPFNHNMRVPFGLTEAQEVYPPSSRTGIDDITGETWSDEAYPDVRAKITLYAKWRANPEGVTGIKVRYLADHAENDKGYFDSNEKLHTVTMDEVYTDQALATAHSATVPSLPHEDTPDPDRRFLYWEVLDKNGNPTDEIVYPGGPVTIDINKAVEIKTPLPDPNGTHTNEGASTIASVAAVAPTCTGTGGNAVTQPNLSSGKADSSANLTNLSANANPNPVTATTEYWEETSSIVPNEEYLIGIQKNGNVYLIVNYSPLGNHYYVQNGPTYDSSGGVYRTYLLGYTALAVVDSNGHVTGVNDTTASGLSNCTWKFSSSTGGTITSAADSTRYLYGNLDVGNNYSNYIVSCYPATTATTWIWNSTYSYLYASVTSPYYTNYRAVPDYYSESGTNVVLSYLYNGTSALPTDGSIVHKLYRKVTVSTPTTYYVTVASGITNGTVSADKATAAEGETVTLTVTPDTGYELENLTVTDASNNPVTVTNNQFTMPASDVTVSATFSSVATDWKVSFADENGYPIPSMNNVYVPKDSPTLNESDLPDPAKEDYYFLGWYQGDTACTFPMTVNSDIVLTPRYSPMYAYDYTLTLRAVYGPYNPDATTHIYWYANNGTDAHNGAGERYTSKYTVTEGGTTTTTTKLPINAHVDIPLPTGNPESQTVFVGDNNGTLTWEDHVFLGWARVDNGGSADYAEARILTPDDIYLKWTGDRYEYRQADGTFSENWTMQQVYADETTPYHDMYAVWAGFYYVYHSSDGTLEAVEFTGTKQVDETTGKTTLVPATKNLVSMVRDGYIYGGYYKSYRGAQKIDGGEAYMKSQINSKVLQSTDFWDYTNSKIADDAINYIDLTDDGAVHYNATTDKIELDGSLVRLWNKTDAYGKTETGEAWAAVKGSAMTPVVGKIYYLREVPNAYLPNVALAIYDKKDESGHVTDEISRVYVLSASDELLYTTTQFSLAEDKVKATVSKQFIVDYREPNQDGGYTPTTVTYTADKLRAGLEGKIGWVLSYEIPVANLKTGTGLVVKPSWTTYDGVTVYGDQFTYKITPDGKTLERNN